MMIFVDRYADALGEICGDIGCDYNDSLLCVMHEFMEPQKIQLNRYDSFMYDTNAFDEALNKFNSKMDTKYHIGTKHNIFNQDSDDDSLSVQPISYIFSIIELQYLELSDGEATEFSNEINEVLYEKNLPWKLVDGKMIKIDSKQFECDLKNKTLDMMKELKDAEPKFKSAFNELTMALEAFQKGEYQVAISNAGKSYESVLKVILDVDKGNADRLTSEYIEQKLCVPETMSKQGFKEKVMMALPFVRNNSGADHGAGTKDVIISKPMAKLAINLAATLETFLIEEYLENLCNH